MKDEQFDDYALNLALKKAERGFANAKKFR